jgi:hypothetical protein
MTQLTPQKGPTAYSDLRQPIASLLCDEAVTANQIGKLPKAVPQPGKRPTLHLGDKVKKTPTKASV